MGVSQVWGKYVVCWVWLSLSLMVLANAAARALLHTTQSVSTVLVLFSISFLSYFSFFSSSFLFSYSRFLFLLVPCCHTISYPSFHIPFPLPSFFAAPPPSIFAPSTAKPESIHTTHPQPTTLLVHAPNTITSILQYHHYHHHHHHHHHHHLQHNSTSDNDTASPTPVLRTILLPDLSSYSLHFPLDTNLSPLKLLTHRNP